MIDTLKRIFSPAADEAPPTSREVRELEVEVAREFESANKQHRTLRSKRQKLLATATEEEIVAHDEEVEALERRLELLEARKGALRHRRKELEIEEAEAEMPARVERMGQAFEEYQRAVTAMSRARGRLTNAAGDVEQGWHLLETKRPQALRGLPIISERMKADIRNATGRKMKLPRPKPEDPNEPRAILQPNGSFRFEGEWTEHEKERFLSGQAPTWRGPNATRFGPAGPSSSPAIRPD